MVGEYMGILESLILWLKKHLIVTFILSGTTISLLTRYTETSNGTMSIRKAIAHSVVDGVFAAMAAGTLMHYVPDLQIGVLIVSAAVFGSLGKSTLIITIRKVLKLGDK